jgi:dihydrodipicolinate synthase/N-acetylneuraminate lyase
VHGIVPVFANYDPQTCVRSYEAAMQGDRKALAEQMPKFLQRRNTILRSGVSWIAGIKYAMSALRFGTGLCVSPIEPIEPGRKKKIDAMIKKD